MIKRNPLKGRTILVLIETRGECSSAIPRVFKTLDNAASYLARRGISAERVADAVARTKGQLGQYTVTASYACLVDGNTCYTLCTCEAEA